MTDQIDAVEPSNISASWDGLPAARITVFANPRGQWFDLEGNNAGAGLVATAIRQRFDAGYWSGIYVNETTEADATTALTREGLHWTDALFWPAPGVYEWCADPSGNIATGRWKPPVSPVAVQDRYPGPYDLSRVNGPYTGRVAGYIDGPQSKWPAAAWNRFTTIPDSGPGQPTISIGNGDNPMYYILETTDTGHAFLVEFKLGGLHKTYIPDPVALGEFGKTLVVVKWDSQDAAAIPSVGPGPTS